MGLCRGSAIAQSAKFRREMHRGCTAALSAVTDGVAMEAPVSLGEDFETVGSGGFSKTYAIFLGRRSAGGGDRLNSL